MPFDSPYKFYLADLSFSNHPLSFRSDSAKRKYIDGLYEAISIIKNNSSKLNFGLKRLSEILGVTMPNLKLVGDCKLIKKAQGILFGKRGFYRMSSCFWWDFFYLCYIADVKFKEKTLRQLREANNIFSSKYFEASYAFFKNRSISKFLPQTLTSSFNNWEEKVFIPIKKIIVIGAMSSGKSTLINSLIGEKLKCVKNTACTSKASYIYNNPFSVGITYRNNGTYIWSESPDLKLDDYSDMSLKFNSVFGDYPVIFIDSPGMNFTYDPQHLSITKTLVESSDYDALICVVNAAYLESEDDMKIIEIALSSGCSRIIFVINQYDRFDPDDDSISENLEIFRQLLKNKFNQIKNSPRDVN